MVLPTATVLPCRGDGRRKNPGQFFSFSNQCLIVTHTRVTKIPEPICSFVRFFEGDAKLGLELRVRSTAPRGAIVRTHPVGCPPKLISGLLRFFGFRQRPAEVKNSQGEQFRPDKQVEPRHPHDEARAVPTPVSEFPAYSKPPTQLVVLSTYFSTFPLFKFFTYFGASPSIGATPRPGPAPDAWPSVARAPARMITASSPA